jgi:hypothetical protein
LVDGRRRMILPGGSESSPAKGSSDIR